MIKREWKKFIPRIEKIDVPSNSVAFHLYDEEKFFGGIKFGEEVGIYIFHYLKKKYRVSIFNNDTTKFGTEYIFEKIEEKKVKKIKVNKIRCNYCGDIIESKTAHDFRFCQCGKVAVDGGKEYLKRCFVSNPERDYEELSEYE